jgi:hypothetical protein
MQTQRKKYSPHPDVQRAALRVDPPRQSKSDVSDLDQSYDWPNPGIPGFGWAGG